MKVYEAIANALKECGGGHLFGLMGDGNLRFINYWVHGLDMAYHGARHESAGIAMADGYTRVAGTFAVATTTQGPGLTNALTALVAARKSQSPLVYVVGDVSTHQQGWPQDIDHHAMFAAAGVPLVDISDPSRAFSETVQAVRTATGQRTPIGINMPVDLQELEWDPWTDDTDITIDRRTDEFSGDIDGAAAMLAESRRPVIIAGRGAVEAGCEEQLVELGDRIGALYATTLKGKGLFQDHPFSLGICGGLGTNLTTTLIGQADAALIVGAGMNDFTTVRQTLLRPDANAVRCDIDPSVATANVGVERVLAGNAAGSVAALLDRLAPAVDAQSVGFRTPERADELRTFRPESEIAFVDEPDLIDPRELVIMLDELLPKQRNVVTDAGRFFGDPCCYMTVPDANAFVDGISFGSIGLGLGLSMGVAAARPERLTVVYIGDGGLFMSLGELETAVRYGTPMLIVVMNDSAYGSELQISRVWGLPDDLSVFPRGDFAAIADGIGMRSATATSVEDVLAALEGVDLMQSPYLIDCSINPNISARWLDDAFERG
jgi:acetolactate synthase-1/2/3 large subunit